MSRQAVNEIKEATHQDVQFTAMRALLRAHKQTLTQGMREEHFGTIRAAITDAIEKAYATGWADRGRVEQTSTGGTGR